MKIEEIESEYNYDDENVKSNIDILMDEMKISQSNGNHIKYENDSSSEEEDDDDDDENIINNEQNNSDIKENEKDNVIIISKIDEDIIDENIEQDYETIKSNFNNELEDFLFAFKNKDFISESVLGHKFKTKEHNRLLEFLKSDKHFKTISNGYNKEFIYRFIENYKLTGLTSEDAIILKNEFFKDIILEEQINQIIPEEIIEINENDLDLTSDNFESRFTNFDEIDELEFIKEKENNDYTKENTFLNENKNQPPRSILKNVYQNNLTSVISNMESAEIHTIPTIKEDIKKNTKQYGPNLKEIEKIKNKKIKSFKFLEANTNLKFDIEKKKAIVNFFKDHDSNINLLIDDLYAKDENNNPIFTKEEINECYDSICLLEKRRRNVLDPGLFIHVLGFKLIEVIANWFNIEEFKGINEDIMSQRPLPYILDKSKTDINNYINEILPDNGCFEFLYFLGGYYMKKKFKMDLLN